MRIAICDDEPNVAKVLLGHIERSLKKWNVKADITSFSSGSQILETIKEINIVFLDIEMPEMDGLEVGAAIKQMNPSCIIIMATGKVERFKVSFKINAFRFITKPFDSNEVDEAIEAIVKKRIGEETVQLYFNRVQYEIPQKKIQCIQAFNGYTEAVVEDKYLRKDISLNEFEEILDKRMFMRVHKKFIVNMSFIESYTSSIIRINELCIPISRRKQKDFEKRYMNFDVNFRG